MPLALFDLDDTLWSRKAAMESWAASLATLVTLGEDPGPLVLSADAGGETDRVEFLDRIHFELRIPLPRREFGHWYDATYPKHFHPFRGVKDGLIRLHANAWHLGVVTNGNGTRQLAKLRATELDSFFGVVIASDEAGVRKPDPVIFLLAADQLGCPIEGWMIGDSPLEDMVGARRAGLSTAWVNLHGEWDPTYPEPDLSAPTAAHLLALIEGTQNPKV